MQILLYAMEKELCTNNYISGSHTEWVQAAVGVVGIVERTMMKKKRGEF